MSSMALMSTRVTDRAAGDELAWAAVIGRDRRRDGAFVYAVSTTGVYCRPSCPARRPRREHVSFFAAPADAERAGYRPCRRCRPHAASGTPTERSVRAAREYLDQHTDRAVTLARLSREVGLSPAYLQRAFTRLVGISPKAYQDAARRERLKARLRGGDTVTRASYEAGFGSTSPLYRGSRTPLGRGITPGAYRRGGAHLRIDYAIVPCSLGRVLVAATERGVCAVMLGDDDTALSRELAAEFRAAQIIRDDEAIAPWVRAVVAQVDGATRDAAVPLDLHGTAFQLRVWRALQAIPFGETRSYAQLAAAIGQPSAVRAVAGACASNHASIIVPCHRVIGANGTPTGYRWGIERKRRLLAREHGG